MSLLEKISSELELTQDQKKKLQKFLNSNFKIITCQKNISDNELKTFKFSCISYAVDDLFKSLTDELKKFVKASKKDEANGTNIVVEAIVYNNSEEK